MDDNGKPTQAFQSNGEKAGAAQHLQDRYERVPGRPDYKPYSDEELVSLCVVLVVDDHRD